MAHIAPSILAADFSRLGELVRETEQAGAERIHVDVMDGHFVPNLSMGPVVVKGLRPRTALPLEVHLMIEKPAMFIEPFSKAGSNTLIVHIEVLPDPRPAFARIRQLGNKVGLALNPETPLEMIEPFLGEIDLALCMTVHPGFGGQEFLPESPERIRRLRQLLDKGNPRCELEVDGGINVDTAQETQNAGANVFVVGSGIFNDPDGPTAAMHKLKGVLADQGNLPL